MDSAKFVLSKECVKEQLIKVNGLADEVSYSFKTNYEVGKVLEEIGGCDFSVHSVESLKMLGCVERVWFFGQAWCEDELINLFERGVRKFVVDNQKDLDLLLGFMKEKNVGIELLLRMRLKEHTIHKGKHFVFGFYSKDVRGLVKELKEKENIVKLGIHFHRKTQNLSDWGLIEELEGCFDEGFFDCIDFVNIGGGLPCVYKNYREGVVESVLEKIKEVRKWLNLKGVKMIVEPGRFIAGPSIKLIAKVKNIYDGNIIINCSVYNSAMDSFVSHVRLLVENEFGCGGERVKAYTIKGCTPDSLDVFRYKVFLKDGGGGDEIVFLNAGAYNFSTDFCNLEKLETVFVERF
tara:strand:+ start:1238 stop:2284 length:1047 start_codon:yes stop_codon:yes gene_type:complete